MADGADQDDNHRPAEADDSRFTRLGRLLRRTRMDELPQLFNILRGDMHFVGPRPFVLIKNRNAWKRFPYYRIRWAVKPGATGWAQINRGYNVSIEDNKEKLAYDLFYIRNFSLGLDLLIFLKTIKILTSWAGLAMKLRSPLPYTCSGFRSGMVAYAYFVYPLLLFVMYGLVQLLSDVRYLLTRSDRRVGSRKGEVFPVSRLLFLHTMRKPTYPKKSKTLDRQITREKNFRLCLFPMDRRILPIKSCLACKTPASKW